MNQSITRQSLNLMKTTISSTFSIFHRNYNPTFFYKDLSIRKTNNPLAKP